MNVFYTYAYLREDGTPYYIGKGKDDRVYKKGKGQINPPKDKSRIIFLKKNLTEQEAFKHEIYMIFIFGRKDIRTGILRNRTDGGQGASGAKRSEETRKKLSESKKGNKNAMFGHNLSDEHRKKLKERMSGSKNNHAKNILIINISGENYIVCGEFITFCKNKKLPLEGIRKRIQRGSKTPTKCGWYAFDITNKKEKEVEELKNKFVVNHKNRFNDNLNSIKIPDNIKVAQKSVNIVFNFIKEKIEKSGDMCEIIGGKKYVKITLDELKNAGISVKTVSRATKVLKENKIIDIKKLNKNTFDHSNFYSLCSQF